MTDLRVLSSYEILTPSPEMIEESKNPTGKKVILRGIIQRADVLNQNGRIYPRAILEREVRNYQKMIIENRALGELDHPAESVVSLKNVSHIMREVKMEQDGTVMGAVELLDNTPAGEIAKALVANGVKLGISSRGVGSTRRQGDWVIVEEDFQLITFDLVSEPSTPAAFLLPEGKVVNPNDLKQFFTKSDRINRVINDLLYRK